MARALYMATIQVLLPEQDKYGARIDSPEAAADYISETFRDLELFEDWGYLAVGGQLLSPQVKLVNDAATYNEGDFLE